MIGIRGSLVILQVTRDARCGTEIVIVIDMAIGALPGRDGVHPSQRERGQGMVKRGIGPGDRVVTLIARLREASRNVIRIRRRLVILHVATHACRGRQVENIVQVAIGADPRRHRMSAGERKSRG